MKKLIIPVITFIIGISLIALSVIKGQADFGIFIIFPMIIGGGLYLFLGVLLIVISFILPFIITITGTKKDSREGYKVEKKKSDTKYGGVIFIGPIPIVFGKDKSVTTKMMYIGFAIAVLLLIVYLIIIFA
ncbi:MAG: TIGR00304 family membrane protein [Thermoplasmatota archaeon]